MSRSFLYLLYFISYSFGYAQGLYNNGANIVFSGAAQIYIDDVNNGNYYTTGSGSITASSSSTITLLKNWTNNSSNNGFATPDGGGVVLAGNAQTIDGSAATAFYNLSLTGNGVKTLAVSPAVNTTTVGGQATFTGILSVGTSTLDLNSRRIDITNSAIGAITSGATGYIISETPAAVNPSIIRWYTRNTTGAHVYPFGVGGLKIPFTFDITSAMGATDYIDVSTRYTTTAFNLPWAGPSNIGGAVTQMYSPNGPFTDGSDEVVIDRWWDVTNSSNVTANMIFSYRGIENTLLAPYNVGFIGPQYWNGSAWISDNLIIGSGAASVMGAGVVGSVSVGGVSTFCPWVLSSKLAPLPVELVSFEAKCVNDDIVLEWCTLSENNNDYFSINQSTDGINFTPIGKVFSSSSSTEKHCYQFISKSLSDINYFQLSQTDNNGLTQKLKTISVNSCQNSNGNILIAHNGSNQLGVILNALTDQTLQLVVNNALGQLVEVKTINAVKGYNNISVDLNNVSNALYYVSVYNGSEKLISKKIVVADYLK
jgi:hypothetical protein